MTPSYCRLFLATPERFDLSEMQTVLQAAIAAGDIASLLIRHEDADKQKQAAQGLTKMAQDAGIAVLIDNDAGLALSCRADGVQVDGFAEDYQAAREMLGAEAIVGVFCGTNRHSAMSLAESGADYVAFSQEAVAGENEPIGHWWARVFEVPCVVQVEELDASRNSVAGLAVANQVDFICPPATMWTSETQAGDTVRQFNSMIREIPIETS